MIMKLRRILLICISVLAVLSLSSCGAMRHYRHPEPPPHHHRHDVPPPPPPHYRPHHPGDRDHVRPPRHHDGRRHRHYRPDRRKREMRSYGRHHRHGMAAVFPAQRYDGVYYMEA